MFLKNYTSDVPVSITIDRIEATLIKCGIQHIAKEYDVNGNTVALIFKIPTAHGDTPVRFPADKLKAQEALWQDYCKRVGRRQKNKADFAEQAHRTAWKLMQDWIEVQMSMIVLNQAEHEQVFLPYIWDGRQTAYEYLKSTNYRGLLPEKASS